jgi:hypothetical protein
VALKRNHRRYGPTRFRRELAVRCSGVTVYSPKLRRGMRELRAALEAIAVRIAAAYPQEGRPRRLSEGVGCVA